MKWIKDLLIGAMLIVQSVFPSKEDEHQKQETELGELEPKKVWDDWDRMIHHDDVTQEEVQALFPKDLENMTPDEMKAFREAEITVFNRQKEFLEMWRDKEGRKEKFQEGYLKDADLGREQTPMHEREGWEDDDDMPETFVGVNQVTGALEEIRFDDLEEWQNNKEGSNE